MKRVVMAVLIAACGSSDEVPSCQESITQYYGVGCTFVASSGSATSQIDALNTCEGINMDVPDACRSEFDDWKSCLFGVADNTQCADCSRERDALFACP